MTDEERIKVYGIVDDYRSGKIDVHSLVQGIWDSGYENGQKDSEGGMKEDKYVELNLNAEVKVRLTDKGYERLADIRNEYAVKDDLRDEYYWKSKADGDGYLKMQLWSFMEDFGPITRIGMSEYYETAVLIKKEDLRDI